MRSFASRKYQAEYFSYAKTFRKHLQSENRPTRKTHTFNEFVRFFLKSKWKRADAPELLCCAYISCDVKSARSTFYTLFQKQSFIKLNKVAVFGNVIRQRLKFCFCADAEFWFFLPR